MFEITLNILVNNEAILPVLVFIIRTNFGKNHINPITKITTKTRATSGNMIAKQTPPIAIISSIILITIFEKGSGEGLASEIADGVAIDGDVLGERIAGCECLGGLLCQRGHLAEDVKLRCPTGPSVQTPPPSCPRCARLEAMRSKSVGSIRGRSK